MIKDLKDQPDYPYIEKNDPWSSHSIIQNWLKSFTSGTRILDIGSAKGMLGKGCAGSNFYLKGIEPVLEWAEEAEPFYDEFLWSSLEQAPEEFLAKQDVVICADVLEHMPNPEKTLKHLVSLQKPETQFLISVPNIANIWIRVNLLFGKFNYSENGILDKTHLRFFTKSTFLEMLASSALQPIELKFTPIPLCRVNSYFQTNFMGRLIHRTLAALTSFLPGLFAYQFVARAKIMYLEQTP